MCVCFRLRVLLGGIHSLWWCMGALRFVLLAFEQCQVVGRVLAMQNRRAYRWRLQQRLQRWHETDTKPSGTHDILDVCIIVPLILASTVRTNLASPYKLTDWEHFATSSKTSFSWYFGSKATDESTSKPDDPVMCKDSSKEKCCARDIQSARKLRTGHLFGTLPAEDEKLSG